MVFHERTTGVGTTGVRTTGVGTTGVRTTGVGTTFSFVDAS
jgi:hypothetical protein